jgi:hypothetical protein
MNDLRGSATVWSSPFPESELFYIGKFEEVNVTCRTCTEPYFSLTGKPSFLDSEIQVAWVLSNGNFDDRWIKKYLTFFPLRRHSKLVIEVDDTGIQLVQCKIDSWTRNKSNNPVSYKNIQGLAEGLIYTPSEKKLLAHAS